MARVTTVLNSHLARTHLFAVDTEERLGIPPETDDDVEEDEEQDESEASS